VGFPNSLSEPNAVKAKIELLNINLTRGQETHENWENTPAVNDSPDVGGFLDG
jgi:hypothetical protein